MYVCSYVHPFRSAVYPTGVTTYAHIPKVWAINFALNFSIILTNVTLSAFTHPAILRAGIWMFACLTRYGPLARGVICEGLKPTLP